MGERRERGETSTKFRLKENEAALKSKVKKNLKKKTNERKTKWRNDN